mgnify:FL=1
MTSNQIAAHVDHVSKRFRVFHERHQSLKHAVLNRRRGKYEEFWALDDVTFDVATGETFAVVGHNGSGKSTLLKCLTRILTPDRGSVTVNGSISALLELGAGFHPELSGRENVFLNAAILGVPRREITAKFDEIVAFSELEQFIDQPVKNYSSGMFVRLGFAVAVTVDPDVLIIDEVLAVGDASFQRKCMDRIADFRDRGRTIILVTHSMDAAYKVADRVAWLDHGHLKMVGDADEVISAYTESQLGTVERPTGEVLVDTVSTVDHAGRAASEFSTGDALALKVALRRVSGDRPCTVTLTIRGHGGVEIAQLTSEPVATTESPLVYEVSTLPLLSGSYSVFCDVNDAETRRLLHRLADPAPLEVRPGRSGEAGLVSLGGRWR